MSYEALRTAYDGAMALLLNGDIWAGHEMHGAAAPEGDRGALLDQIVGAFSDGRAASVYDLAALCALPGPCGAAAAAARELMGMLRNWASFAEMALGDQLKAPALTPMPTPKATRAPVKARVDTRRAAPTKKKLQPQVSQVGRLLPEDEADSAWLCAFPSKVIQVVASPPAAPAAAPVPAAAPAAAPAAPQPQPQQPAATPILDNSSGPGAVCCPACLRPGRLNLGMAGLSPGRRSGGVVVVRASGGVLATAIPAGLRRSGRSSSGGSGSLGSFSFCSFPQLQSIGESL
jgi:hypothetical protein